MSGDTKEEALSEDMPLEGRLESFNADEYKQIKSNLENKYKFQNGSGNTSMDIKKAKKSIDGAARKAMAQQAFQNETLQGLYAGALAIFGQNAKKIYSSSEETVEKDIAKDFDLLRTIENQYYSNMKNYDSNLKRLLDQFEEQRKLEIAKDGFAREVEELKYVLQCKKSGEGIDASKLSIVDPQLGNKSISQITELIRRYDQNSHRIQIDVTRNYLNQTLLGSKLESAELQQQAYQNDMSTVMKGIVATIEQINTGYIDLNSLLDTKIQIAERMEGKQHVVNSHNRKSAAILSQSAEVRDVLMHPYSPQFEQYDNSNSTTALGESIKEQSQDNDVAMDSLKVHSEKLKNKYLQS